MRQLTLAALLCSPAGSYAAPLHDEQLSQAMEPGMRRDLVYHLPPDGSGEAFADELIAGPFTSAVGLLFDSNEQLWLWEKAGRAYFIDDDGTVAAEPMFDISEEVGDWGGGNGMLGFAIAPDFETSGYVYLLYVVDHHHLAHFGTPSYDPLANEDYVDTIGRLTRYRVFDPQASAEDLRIDPSSRTILIGETAGTGFPVCTHTHAVGSLFFGEDGSLLASCGDGHLVEGSSGTCYSEGIINDKENVDHFRSQLLDTLSGKVVRLDPITGEGLSDNPFFDPLAPAAPRSLVWSLGLRQPYRVSLRPGTGNSGHPGTLFIGDVGGQDWEELNVAPAAGMNFGWPIFEGAFKKSPAPKIPNLDAPNPLFGQTVGGELCEQEFFYFGDLLHPEVGPGTFLDLPHPCNPNAQVPFKWMHTGPELSWGHAEGLTMAKSVDGSGQPLQEELGVTVPGALFSGGAAVGGVWYGGTDFPAQFQDAYFLGDYSGGWIRCLRFDQDNHLSEVLTLTEQAGAPVALATHPSHGGLYYIHFSFSGVSYLRHITFVDNLPPVANITSDVHYGPAPLSVQFSAESSYDPEGGPLTYAWDFGDGATSSDVAPQHVYLAPSGAPTSFTATLSVTDSLGLARSATQLVSANNTPPSIDILAPLNGVSYPESTIQAVDLLSAVSDIEHAPGEVACEWNVILYHDDHTHPQPVDPECLSSTITSPHTVDGDTEYIAVILTATDAAGLSSSLTHVLPRGDDCNLNGFPDAIDIAQGSSQDTDLNGVPDECSFDCDANGLPDPFEIAAHLQQDCNTNGVPDDCEIALGAAFDLDADGVPDTCQELSADLGSISISSGGAQTLTLSGGPWAPGDLYWILGSATGTSPGTSLGAVELPLVADFYFIFSLTTPSSPVLVQSLGFLDAQASAQAAIQFAPSSPPGLAGLSLYHAAFVADAAQLEISGIYDATNWMPLQLVP